MQVQTEQLRSSLLSSVSHDLRTPLAAIAGASSSAAGWSHGARSRSRASCSQTIVDESRRLARLVDNLLDMTRLESGTVTLQQAMARAGGNRRLGAAPACGGELAGHRVDVDLPRDLPLVSLDGVLIEQVLVNLLENAARYTPAGSRDRDHGARDVPERVELRVADNGPGLPPGSGGARLREVLSRRGHVRPTAAAASGWDWRSAGPSSRPTAAASRRGIGPTAAQSSSFRLPCEPATPHVALDELPAASGAGHARYRATSAASSRTKLPIRRFLRASLSGEGYRLTEAETGQQALRVAAQQPPDLVILDLGLPDIDGQEVLRQLREWLRAPIIVLSARDQEQQKIQALDQRG